MPSNEQLAFLNTYRRAANNTPSEAIDTPICPAAVAISDPTTEPHMVVKLKDERTHAGHMAKDPNIIDGIALFPPYLMEVDTNAPLIRLAAII